MTLEDYILCLILYGCETRSVVLSEEHVQLGLFNSGSEDNMYMYMCVCVCVYVCMYVCVCGCIYVYIQGVPGGMCQTSGGCSLC